MDAHIALQQTGARVKQNALHFACDHRVSGGDVDGQRFMPDIHENWAAIARLLLVGHGFPYRRPFGSG